MEEPPFSLREGGVIREGFDPEADELRQLLGGGTDRLAEIEARERERTGIPKLKVSYNKVFGYYFEVTNSFKEMVPDDWIRKQTLTGGERYMMPKLKELEDTILNAEDKLCSVEYDIFCEIREHIADNMDRIQKTAKAVAALDVFTSLANVAERNHYVRPKLNTRGTIKIKNGRHPVVEKMIDHDMFVANDTSLDSNKNLISIITTDIELLEVFYAHTISPIAIATLTSIVMVIFIGRYHWLAGVLALASYLIVGIVIPMWNGKRGSQKGMEFRTNFGELNSFVLDSLRGLDETIQYGQGEKRKEQMSEHSKNLAGMQESLSKMEGSQRSFTNMVILLASFGMLALTIWLYDKGAMGFEGILTCTIAMMGSFGPVVALSSLSNNLNQTLASGERVLSLLEETPLVEEIPVVGDQPDLLVNDPFLHIRYALPVLIVAISFPFPL